MAAVHAAQGEIDVEDTVRRCYKSLECPVCMDVLKEPMRTPCNHEFCRRCIMLTLDRRQMCPICVTPVTKRALNDCPRLKDIIAEAKNVVRAIQADVEAADDASDLSPNAFPMSQMQSQLTTLKRYTENPQRKAVMNAQPCAFRAPPEDVDCGAAAASSDTDDDAKSDSDDANRPSAKAPKRGAAAAAVRRQRGKQTASALRRGESPQTASDLGAPANSKGAKTDGAAATRSPASKLKNVTNAATQSKAPAKSTRNTKIKIELSEGSFKGRRNSRSRTHQLDADANEDTDARQRRSSRRGVKQETEGNAGGFLNDELEKAIRISKALYERERRAEMRLKDAEEEEILKRLSREASRQSEKSVAAAMEDDGPSTNSAAATSSPVPKKAKRQPSRKAGADPSAKKEASQAGPSETGVSRASSQQDQPISPAPQRRSTRHSQSNSGPASQAVVAIEDEGTQPRPAEPPMPPATAKGPTAKGPTAKGPTAKGPTAKGPTAKSPTAKGPTAQGPTAKGPTAQGPTAKGHATKSSVIDAPAEGPAAQDLSPHGPAAKNPVAKGALGKGSPSASANATRETRQTRSQPKSQPPVVPMEVDDSDEEEAVVSARPGPTRNNRTPAVLMDSDDAESDGEEPEAANAATSARDKVKAPEALQDKTTLLSQGSANEQERSFLNSPSQGSAGPRKLRLSRRRNTQEGSQASTSQESSQPQSGAVLHASSEVVKGGKRGTPKPQPVKVLSSLLEASSSETQVDADSEPPLSQRELVAQPAVAASASSQPNTEGESLSSRLQSLGGKGLVAAAERSSRSQTRDGSKRTQDARHGPAPQADTPSLKTFSSYITAPVNALLKAIQPATSQSASHSVNKSDTSEPASETIATLSTMASETEMRSSSADSQTAKESEARIAHHTEPAVSATADMGDYESFQIVASQSALDAAPRGVLEGTRLLFTNVNDVGLEQGLKETALALGAELATDFSSSVTHVLTNMDAQRWAETATMKMMYALASGTWIVSLDWLAASETANCMVAEEKFVMQGNHATGESSDGAFFRRREALQRGQSGLMKGITLSFSGEFATPNAIQDFSGLVKIMGAEVLPLGQMLRLADAKALKPKSFVVADASTFERSLATDADFARAHEKGLLLDFWWIVDTVTDQLHHDPLDEVYAVPGEETQTQA